MGVAVDYQIDVVELLPDHLALHVDLVLAVGQPGAEPAEGKDFFPRKARLGLDIVHIAGNGLDRSDRSEFVEHRELDNVSRVHYQVNAAEHVEDLCRNRRLRRRHMRIGQNAYSHECSLLKKLSSPKAFPGSAAALQRSG